MNGSLQICVHELKDQVKVLVIFGTMDIQKTNYVGMITENFLKKINLGKGQLINANPSFSKSSKSQIVYLLIFKVK